MISNAINIRIRSISFIIGFLISLCCVFSKFKISTYIALFLFVLYFGILLWKNTNLYIKYIYIFFECFSVLISMSLIEIGEFYVSERRMMGHYVGSTPLLIFFYWVFFEMLIYFDYKHEKRTFAKKTEGILIDSVFSSSNIRIRKMLRYITYISVFLLAYMFANVIKNPSFLIGLDRTQYSLLFTYSTLYTKVLSWSQILLVPCILSLIYGNKKLGLIGVIFFLLHSFWVGQKFGSFLSTLSLLLIILYPKIRTQKVKTRKIAIKGFILIFILVLFSAFAFSFTSDIGIVQYFATRMAGQGAMWWGTYSVSDGMPHIRQISNEIDGFLFGSLKTSDNVRAKYGIYNIMYLCCPPDKVDYDLQYLNARYTEAGFASAYYIFGFIGGIAFAIICAYLFSITINYFLRFLNKNKILEAALSLRLYYLITVMMSMFTFNQFRSLVVVISVVWILTMKNIRISFKCKIK